MRIYRPGGLADENDRLDGGILTVMAAKYNERVSTNSWTDPAYRRMSNSMQYV